MYSTYTGGMQTQVPCRAKQVGKGVNCHGKTFGNGRNWVRMKGA